ncbi:MAG: hypothetical protein IKR38_01815 [Bacteroidales bacterium]|nr:hypothetical protein [Bacteroidales bacterium]
MKKIILAIVLLTACAAAYGQYIPDGTAKRYGSKIRIDGQKLTPQQQVMLLSDIDGKDYNRSWKNANLTRKWGIGLTAAGGTVAVVGAGGTLVMIIATAFGVGLGAVAGAMAGSVGGEEQASETASEAADNVAEEMGPKIAAWATVTGVGLVSTAVGIPLWITGSSKMGKIVKTYNGAARHADSGLYFGPTASGAGFAYVF